MTITEAIVVEGRDDVAAVSQATDALIIPTHGFGIARETWEMLEKAYKEKGLIILTDPDHAGEEIRKKLTEKFPDALQAYVARSDATDAEDIGIENAKPEIIAEALKKAKVCHPERSEGSQTEEILRHRVPQNDTSGCHPVHYADMSDLRDLGLVGSEGAAELRAAVTKSLGIGYGNAGALIKKLRGFGIGLDELKEEVEKIRK